MSEENQIQDLAKLNMSLLKGLSSDDAAERSKAVQALGELGNVRVIPSLVYALADLQPDVIEAIQKVLVRFGAPAIEPIIATLRTVNSDVQDFIARAKVTEIRPPDYIENAIWRMWLTYGFGKHTDRLNGFLGVKSQLMASQNGQVTQLDIFSTRLPYLAVKISIGVIEVLKTLRPVVTESLIAYLTDQAVLVRWVAVQALSGIKTAQVTQALIPILSDPVLLLSQSALTALTAPAQTNDIDLPSQAEAASAVVHHLLYRKIPNGILILEEAEGLINFGDKALPPLLEVVCNQSLTEDLRRKALRYLGQYNHPGAVEPLIGLLADSSPTMLEEVIRVLGRLEDRRAVEPLLNLLPNQPLKIWKKAVEVLGQLKATEAVPSLLEVVASDNAERQTTAISALGKIGDVRAVEPLLNILNSEDITLFASIADALGNLKDSRAVEPLINLLNSENTSVHQSAASALGMLGDNRAVEPLLNLLHWQPSYQVMTALGRLGDKRATPHLLPFLESEDENIRINTTNALGLLGDSQTVEPLIKALQDTASYVRFEAAESLGKLGDSRALPALEWAVQNDLVYPDNLDQSVSEVARKAIAAIKAKQEGRTSEVDKDEIE